MFDNSLNLFENNFVSSLLIIIFILFIAFLFKKFTKKDFLELKQVNEQLKKKPLSNQKIEINFNNQILLLKIKHILIVISFLLFLILIT